MARLDKPTQEVAGAVQGGRSGKLAATRTDREVFGTDLLESLIEAASRDRSWFQACCKQHAPHAVVEMFVGVAPELSDSALRKILNRVLQEM